MVLAKYFAEELLGSSVTWMLLFYQKQAQNVTEAQSFPICLDEFQLLCPEGMDKLREKGRHSLICLNLVYLGL